MQMLCVLLDWDTSHLRRRRCIFRGNAKVDAYLGDAATAFVFWKLHLHSAAHKTVVELLELRQFPPDSEFNRFDGPSVLKFDL